MTYNPDSYRHGETVLLLRDGGRVVIDEVLDDDLGVRYENDWDVFTVPYEAVTRPARSVAELIDTED